MRVSGAWKLAVPAICVLAALMIVAALSPAKGTGPCTVVGDVAMLRDVPEASGLAVSRRRSGLLWTHNDSGNTAVLFAVDASGTVHGRVRVPIRTRDWEDVSAGACPDGDCLYVADIGDNGFTRRSVQVFRVPEPEPGVPQTGGPDVFTLTYPDGPHNAEALFVIEDAVFIVTKDGSGILYRSAPLGENREVTMERVGELGLELVTDAEASRDGQFVAVRTPQDVVVYRTAELIRGGPAPSGVRIPVDGLREPQGEGVALDGDVLYLASEGRPWNRAGRLISLLCSLPSLPLPLRPAPSAAP
jgi:hypothetical protein